jgi:hypothetical protein
MRHGRIEIHRIARPTCNGDQCAHIKMTSSTPSINSTTSAGSTYAPAAGGDDSTGSVQPPMRATSAGSGLAEHLPSRRRTESSTGMRSDLTEHSEQLHTSSSVTGTDTRRSSGTGSFPAHKIQLGAYLLARSVDGRRIEGDELSRLVRSNDVVNATRLSLPEGRGNVNLDLKMSDGETAYATAAAHMFRSSKQLGDSASIHAAMHMAAKAGNCSHHAHVAINLIGERMGGGDQIHHVRSDEVDHNWAELRSENGSAVTLDAWAEGPAILSEDGIYSSRETRTLYAFGPRLAAKSAKEMHSHTEKAGDLLPDQLSQFSKALRKRGFPEKKIWSPTAVINQAFSDRAREALGSTSALSREIQAVRLARDDLGASVHDATTIASKLVDNAMDLTRTPQNPPRTQRESDFLVGVSEEQLEVIKRAHTPQELEQIGVNVHNRIL